MVIWLLDHETKDCPLDLPKTNNILCLTTIEKPEPAENSRRSSRGEALCPRVHERRIAADILELTSLRKFKQMFT